MAQTLEQFGQTIKAKYPEYNDIPDAELGQKMLAKYPQYQDTVSTSSPQTATAPFPAVDQVVSQARNVIQAANTPFNIALKYTGLPWVTEKLGGIATKGGEYLAKADTAVANAVLPQNIKTPIANGLNKVLNTPIENTRVGKGVVETLKDPATKNALGLVGDVAQLAGNVVGAKELYGGIKSRVVNPYLESRKVANLMRDAKALDNLAGTIVQGKTTDIEAAKNALSTIDTEGVESYTDLKHVLDERINNIDSKLDETLATNPKLIKGGPGASHDYVQDAIGQLKDHYTATNDIPKLEQIKQLEAKANSEGLTIKEVNDLAKIHGRDLNAFNANGQAASGLSKQAAENTRTGLKATARRAFDNPAYKAADVENFKLIKTRDLVAKLEENVNALQQKIKTRTWGEKLGNLAANVVNIVGFNSPKAFIEYFLGRGTGLKTLNALDLQEALQANLTRLQKALKPGIPESDVIKNLQEIVDTANQRASTRLKLPGPSSIPVGGPPKVDTTHLFSSNEAGLMNTTRGFQDASARMLPGPSHVPLPGYNGGESGPINPRLAEEFADQQKRISTQNSRDVFNFEREQNIKAAEELKKRKSAKPPTRAR